MRKIFCITVLFISLQGKAQFSHCDSLLLSGHSIPFDQEGIKTTYDYIKTYFPKQRRFISNRKKLQPLDLLINRDSIMIFEKGKDKVIIKFREKRFKNKDLFYPKEKGEKYSGIRDYSENTPFGVTSEDTVVSYISEIIVNSKQLPVRSFYDLLNPNQYKTILSIKPIKVYKSNCGEYLFIYIFGKLNLDLMSINGAINFSYMAKIVVTKKGYYVDRIVENGYILKYFGFGDCPMFIGF